MTEKPKHIELMDEWIMAPWRYMNFKGESQSQGKFKNFIHKPENKVLLLAGAMTLALNFDLKNSMSLAIVTVAILGVKGVQKAIKPESKTNHFLDTRPESFIDIGEQARKIIGEEKTGVLKNLFNAVTSAIPVALGVFLPQYLENDFDAFVITSAFLAYASYLLTRDSAKDYRIARVVEGHWNMHIGTAPPEEKAVAGYEDVGELIPVEA